VAKWKVSLTNYPKLGELEDVDSLQITHFD